MKRLLPLCVCIALSGNLPHSAHAAMAVIDSAAVAKAGEQLNQMKEQFEKLNEMKKQLDEQLKTIGEFGKITLPTTNVQKLANQLKKDMQCLVPNWKELMPELKFEEQHFSICDKSQFYRDSLWVDPVKVGGKSVITDPTTGAKKTTFDWMEMEAARQKVKQLREAITYDAVTNGLGQADMAIKNTEKNSETIDDLQASIENAKTEREQLQSIAQGMAVNARLLNQQTQLLAQLLKVTSSYVTQATVPIDKREQITPEGEQEQ